MVLNVIKISQVSPSADSFFDPLVFPLTFFDIKWLKDSVQQVILYKLSESSSEFFYSVIIPKLEDSLSLVLGHYLPLAGHLTWDPQEPKPSIVVFPHDTVRLTVLESDADFGSVSGKGIRLAREIRALVPEFPTSSDSPYVLSLQVTLFPNQGFCIGITANHAVMDGKTVVNFCKSWAHICKSQTPGSGTTGLPDDLTPRLDRTIINVPAYLEAKMLELQGSRTLKIPPVEELGHDILRITLELTRENVEKLRERAKSESTRSHSELHLSTFVLAYAYMWTCLVKMRGGHSERPVRLMYAADFRNRLDPPVHQTYLGNCVFPIGCFGHKAKTFLGEDGFVRAVEILSDSVKGLGLLGIEQLCELYVEGKKSVKPGTQLGTIAGSNKFGLYGTDFGWGNPVNTEFVSIDGNEAFSMSERRDDPGGVQMGLCLKQNEMNIFISLFNDGLVN